MNYFLLQIILARRSYDADKWMNVVFVVVLALFWLIGGIIKAKVNKSGAQEGDQSPRKPARKPPLHSREAREQMLKRLQRPADSAQSLKPRPAARKPRMKFADLQAAVRKFAVEAEKAFQVDTGETTTELKPILTEPKIKAERVAFTEPIDKTVIGQQYMQASEAAQTVESEYLYELLTDYSDPDQLRRAILHYEILGKPLSLRDPSEKGI